MSYGHTAYPSLSQQLDRLHVRDHSDSTNAELVRLIVETPRLVNGNHGVITTDQRAGRGRLDRIWITPAGSAIALSVSVPIPDWLSVKMIPLVSLAAGAALTLAIADIVSPDRVSLKWPNDVLIDGKKVAGILAELVTTEAGSSVVVGSGINTAMTRDQLPVDSATSVLIEIGAEPDQDELASRYVSRLLDITAALAQSGGDQGANGLIAQVRSLCSTIGQRVVVTTGDSTIEGDCVDIDDHGRIVVDSGAGDLLRFGVGDVQHLRPSL